jgi:RNA-directed DNA polymerase
MEEVCHPDNLNRAYRRVKANKGAPGADGMTIDDLPSWIAAHKQELIGSLQDGSYEPQPVRGVEIPKAGGGMRQLGIPMLRAYCTSLQRALGMTPLRSVFDHRPGRIAFSFGRRRTRPGLSQHNATCLFCRALWQ